MQLADGATQQPGRPGQRLVDPVDRLGVAVADVLQVHPGGEHVLERSVVEGPSCSSTLALLDVGQLDEQAGPVDRQGGDLHNARPLDPRQRYRADADRHQDDHPQGQGRPRLVVVGLPGGDARRGTRRRSALQEPGPPEGALRGGKDRQQEEPVDDDVGGPACSRPTGPRSAVRTPSTTMSSTRRSQPGSDPATRGRPTHRDAQSTG